MKLESKRMATILACASALLAAGGAAATEGGGNSYAIGVDTLYPGLMFPDGLHLLAYYSNYTAGHSKDNTGNDNARLAYFNSEVNAISLRATYVWPGVKWMGASVETRAALPFPSIDLDLGIARPQPLGALDRSGKESGHGDLSFSPILLGWHSKTVHQTAGIETFIPIAGFDAAQPVNLGRNYYQVAPMYAITYLAKGHAFLPDNSQMSAKLRYAFNSKNKDTNYRSGNEATLEYSADVRVTKSLAIGINGYFYQQTSDDKVNEIAVNGNGNRGRVQAIGPYFIYNFTPKVSLIAKLQFEGHARNRPEGRRIWLQTKFPF